MTIKQDMQAEARKLAEAVRAAAVEFAKSTGMQADISINWVTFHAIESPANEVVVGAVRVDIGGMSVTA